MKNFLRLYLDSYRGLSSSTWMLAAIMLINRTGAMVLPFLGIYMTASLGFNLKETGTVLSCFGIGAVLGSLVGGWLTDQVGHFKVQLLSLLLAVPVFLFLPQLQSPLTLSIGVFVLSLITETFRPANSVSLSSYARPENITRAFSLNRMAVNLGFSIGPALGGFLAAYSYHLLFYGNGFSVGLAGVVFYLYFKRKKKNVPESPEKIVDKQKGISPWKDRKFLTFSFLCCIYSICFFQLLSTLPLFYREIHSLSEWNIGLLLAFSGLVVFALEMIIVHLAERNMKDSQAIILGTLLCGASFLILLISGGQLILYLGMVVLCLSEILAMPFMATVAIKRASKNREGAYMGLNALAFSVAHILSPYLGTRIAANFGFANLWWGTGILCLLTALGFWWNMKRLEIKTV